MSTILQAGKMYQPTDISIDETTNSAFIVERLNHRISKWDYNPSATPPDNFIFTLDAGRITGITVDPSGGGSGYVALGDVDISAPSIDIDNAVQATAEIMTVSSGAITAINLIDGGNGYDDNNLPSVTAPTAGTPASLTAAVSTPWGTNRNGTTGQAGPVTDGGPTDVFFDNPRSIANDGTRLYVTDTFHNRIRTINLSTGDFISFVGPAVPGLIDLHHPTGLDIHVSSNFFVIADKVNARAIEYSTVDTPLFIKVLEPPTPVPFNIPHGVIHISFSSPETITITDRHEGVLSNYNHNTLAFIIQGGFPSADPTLDEALYHPGGGHADVQNMMEFVNTGNNILKRFGSGFLINSPNQPGEGITLGKLNRPENMFRFIDTGSYMLIVNTLNNRIEVFDTTANIKNQFGSPIPVLP